LKFLLLALHSTVANQHHQFITYTSQSPYLHIWLYHSYDTFRT